MSVEINLNDHKLSSLCNTHRLEGGYIRNAIVYSLLKNLISEDPILSKKYKIADCGCIYIIKTIKRGLIKII